MSDTPFRRDPKPLPAGWDPLVTALEDAQARAAQEWSRWAAYAAQNPRKAREEVALTIAALVIVVGLAILAWEAWAYWHPVIKPSMMLP